MEPTIALALRAGEAIHPRLAADASARWNGYLKILRPGPYRFTATLRLVAPDLRAVLAAVEAGMGVSLLPEFVCAEALAAGRVVEVVPVAAHVAAEPFFVGVRPAEAVRPEVAELVALLR